MAGCVFLFQYLFSFFLWLQARNEDSIVFDQGKFFKLSNNVPAPSLISNSLETREGAGTLQDFLQPPVGPKNTFFNKFLKFKKLTLILPHTNANTLPTHDALGHRKRKIFCKWPFKDFGIEFIIIYSHLYSYLSCVDYATQ